MWPMFVDYSEEECKRVLRSLELEAYASVINAFRAQGTLTKDRKKMLQELCATLGISMERHRAEVRRAVNDEHLNTIAERLFGPNTATEWAIEGRRVVPLMQRLAPQTVFTEMANSAASAQAARNASLPLPGKTGSRELSNGIETMASRKRKDFTPDSSVSPQKISAMDTQYFHNLLPLDNSCSMITEPSAAPEVSVSPESFPISESVPQVSPSPTDLNASRSITTSPSVTNSVSSVSPVKSLSKHPLLKPTSTVTTFSSFDQMTSNLLASRASSQAPPAPVIAPDEQVTAAPDTAKQSSSDMKTTRPLSSVGTMKSSTIVIPTPVSSASTTSKDRLPTPPATTTTSPQHNKFLTQIRSKNPGHARQMPAGLGMKLNTNQSPISQRAAVSPKSPNVKVKQQETTSIFNKKATPSTFPSSENQTSQFPTPSSSELPTVPKSPIPVAKTNPKSESSASLSQQSAAKQTTVGKGVPKTTAPNSGYISRSLFSASAKGGAKNISPVIFNVSSTSCTSLPTSTKTTGPTQSDSAKTSPQLLPKSVGLNPGHLKINTSNSQTIQYRNDGGLVRSARIVNISQPVGTRLPCSISPSAISALGLTTNLSSTALRVTLPAGTLNNSSSIRVSAAAKPNVIVVHKAQMWPRAQQGAAVIMSSTPLSKLPNDIAETISMAQKQEKNKPSVTKPGPTRSISTTRPLSPAVSSISLKAPESNPVKASESKSVKAPEPNPTNNITPQPDSSTSETQNSKSTESTNEAQCKKNLLADIIEASGLILDNNSADKSLKGKNDAKKVSKEPGHLANHQDPEITKSSVTSTKEFTSNKLSALNAAKTESSKNDSGDGALSSASQADRNGTNSQKPSVSTTHSEESQSKEASTAAVSSSHVLSESVTSSSESISKNQKEVTKEKDL